MRRQRLKIDPDFRKLTPPVNEQQYKELENLIIARKEKYPIYTWNGYVLYDHTCYDIYRKHKLRYNTTEVALASKNQAISWVCTRILDTIDLPVQYRKYILGEKYMAENAEGLDSEYVSELYKDIPYHRSLHYAKLMILISERYNIGPSYFKHTLRYCKAINRLRDINDKYVTGILDGRIKSTMQAVIDLSALSCHEAKEKIHDLMIPSQESEACLHTKKKTAAEKPLSITVKDMPAYDPDSYVSSLSLTIPSWICSIRRTGENSDAKNISMKARSDLINALDDLITISSIARKALED